MNQENIGKFIASLRKEKKTETRSYFLKESIYMENYNILMEVNRKESLEEKITEEEKQATVEALLNGLASKEDVKKYKLRMRVNPFNDTIYPNYFIPPYNENKKLPMVNGKIPKTHILYTNHYELEIKHLLWK